MIKALMLILRPAKTWEGILQAERSVPFLLMLYLLPLLVLVCAGEGYGLVHWGKWRGYGAHPHLFTVGEAVVFGCCQFLLSLLIVVMGAILIKAVGETFHGRHSLHQTFTVVIYSLSPLFLLRLLDAFVWMSPWVSWGIGILLSIGVLYNGLPRVMEPDPPQAFGLFLMSAILLVLTSGMARFVTAWYLQGKFARLDGLISSLAAHLPF